MRKVAWPAGLALLPFLAAGPTRVLGQAPAVPAPQLGRAPGFDNPPTGTPEPAPRLPDGTPNLGRVPGEKGVWNVRYVFDFGDRVVGHEVAPPERKNGPNPKLPGSRAQPWVPFMPWSAAVYDYHIRNEAKYDPEGYCLPPGGPRMMVTPYPMEIIQIPEQKRILMIFEGATHIWREIYMDGREHPRGDSLNPTFLGHSVGRWDGDTLVIDVVGFNEGSWLDPIGHPHTDLLHLVERLSRPSKQTLHYEATIDDPGAYTRPWTVSWDVSWAPGRELAEYICQENNRYLNRLKDDFGQPVIGVK